MTGVRECGDSGCGIRRIKGEYFTGGGAEQGCAGGCGGFGPGHASMEIGARQNKSESVEVGGDSPLGGASSRALGRLYYRFMKN